jgi:hypothetical protein
MFKISDDDIMSFVQQSFEKEAKKRGLIKEESQKKSIRDGCEDIPIWPSYDLDDLVGKSASEADGRDLLQQLNITGGTVEEKVESLNERLNEAVASGRPGMDIKEEFASFIFLDTIQSLAESERRNPRASGYMLEPIMAAVLGGEHAGGSRQISDINFSNEIKPNEMETGISLKFISGNEVKGSYMNFLEAMLKTGKFYFVGVIKNLSGRKQARKGQKKMQNNEKVDIDVSLTIELFIRKFEIDPGLLRQSIDEILTLYNQQLVAKDSKRNPIKFVNLFNISPKMSGFRQEFVSFFDERAKQDARISKLFQATWYEGSSIHFYAEPISPIRIPAPSILREQAKNKIQQINIYVSKMYENLGVLSCIMKNYISNKDTTRKELAVEVIQVTSGIEAGAVLILRGG